jgi:hypothetical protein
MKQYLLSIYQPDGPPPAPEVLENVMSEIETIRNELKARGAWVFGNGLHPPSTATVLRAQGRRITTTDGPFTEGKEHIGGLMIIQVQDLHEALAWGRRYAEATTLPIEVRPFQGETGD